MRSVKLILREDVGKLGAAGDLVSVKPGFARNYLVPQGKATFATEANIKELEHHRRIIEEKVAKELKDLNVAAKKLSGVTIEVTRRAGEDGKLFGSVTSQHIAELLIEKGFEIDRRRVQLPESIKEVGDHEIEIRLHREVSAKLKLVVSLEGE